MLRARRLNSGIPYQASCSNENYDTNISPHASMILIGLSAAHTMSMIITLGLIGFGLSSSFGAACTVLTKRAIERATWQRAERYMMCAVQKD